MLLISLQTITHYHFKNTPQTHRSIFKHPKGQTNSSNQGHPNPPIPRTSITRTEWSKKGNHETKIKAYKSNEKLNIYKIYMLVGVPTTL